MWMKIPGHSITTSLVYIGAAAILTYIMARSVAVGLTIDEAATLFIASDESAKSVLLYLFPSANNHWFNTICVHFIVRNIGNSEFAIRLPAVLGAALYMTGIYRIFIGFLRHSPLFVPGLILCVANPYLLEYFSLCRGYGMSIGFMIWAIYFLLLLISRHEYRWMIGFFTSGLLMMMSSFVTLHFFLSASLVGGYFCLRHSSVSKRIGLVYAGLFLLTMGIISYPIVQLRSGDQLYWGGNRGLWQDTIRSIIGRIKSDNLDHPWAENTIGIILTVLLIWAFISAIRGNVRRHMPIGFIPALLFTGTLLSIHFQHVLLDVLFVYNRTALFIVPLYILSLVFLADQAVRTLSPQALHLRVAIWMLAALFVANTLSLAQISFASDWPVNSRSLDASRATRDFIDGSGQHPDLCTDHANRYVMDYYLNRRWKMHIRILPIEEWNGSEALFYLSDQQNKEPLGEKLITIRQFEDVGYSLFRARSQYPPDLSPLLQTSGAD